MSLQLIAVVEEPRAESGVSGSCDIITATSSLSDEVSAQLTAEARREMWRRAHGRPRSSDVHQHQPGTRSGRQAQALTSPVCLQVMELSANDSPSEAEAQPTESTALALDASSSHHCSLSQSGECGRGLLLKGSTPSHLSTR